MLKKQLRHFCFSIFILFIACAPKPGIEPPPLHDETALTLEEVISKAGSDIEVLKAITDIRIEKNNELYSTISASVLIKEPEWVHMRMYQLGMLVRDFVIRDNRLYVLSGKNDPKLMTLGKELYNAIFWWDAYREGEMQSRGEIYVITTPDKEIYVESTTLMPVKQEIRTINKNIRVDYSNPVSNEDFWYPSLLNIYMDDFKFIVKLKKILKNPVLGEYDFQVPAGS